MKLNMAKILSVLWVVGLILMIVALSGCSGTKPMPVIVDVTTPTIDPALPRPVTMRNMKFVVLDLDRMEKMVADAKSSGKTKVVLIGMSVKDYESLALNITELERYIRQLRALVEYYKLQNQITPPPTIESNN